MQALVELRDLQIDADIGTYGPTDVVPEAHLLDMTLTIHPQNVLIDHDTMDSVFDYDPLIARIHQLAADRHYETQEYLLTLIARVCAMSEAITGVDLRLRKYPVSRHTGSAGVRLVLDVQDLATIRPSTRSATPPVSEG